MQAIRIVAGVVIILVGLLDLIAGLGYMTGGSIMGTGSRVVKDEMSTLPGSSTDPFGKAATKAADKVEATGAMWTVFALFLLGLAGSGIAAGVLLFMAKGALFVMVVGGLQVLADLISIAAWKHVGVTNLIAIAVGALVAYAGFTYAQFKKAGPATPPSLA